ncbi:MAG: hypothetical protein RLZZ74_3811, partial [Cyanobacteriota bacterium]
MNSMNDAFDELRNRQDGTGDVSSL